MKLISHCEPIFGEAISPTVMKDCFASLAMTVQRSGGLRMKHIIVYQEAGRFAGWPANNGAWQWGDELLVAFDCGDYKANTAGHSIDFERPMPVLQARSLDGGESWTIEAPDRLAQSETLPPAPCPVIDFTHPDFALRCRYDRLIISYDRGKTWQGPYLLPNFGHKLTSRTDYLVNGPEDCLLFLSAFEPRVEAGIQDRAFCARTRDGGRSFEFQGWMTGEPVAYRSVMPSSTRGSVGQLISILRRRHDRLVNGQADKRFWLEAVQSDDDGQTWHTLSKVADTGQLNGNPPSLVRLRDGRLCAAYGYRADPIGMRARISRDEGRTWEAEIILRADGRTWDLGYPRMLQRSDGKLVTVYYFTTAENPQQHIAATIWDPNGI
jgi:hypothetical protein